MGEGTVGRSGSIRYVSLLIRQTTEYLNTAQTRIGTTYTLVQNKIHNPIILKSVATTKPWSEMAKAGVTLQQVRTSNDKLKAYTSGLVALFVGATSGIGKGTLTQLARLADAPTVYIVGRSKTAFAPHLEQLETLNPQGKFVFMETQISLIKNVDHICEEIKHKERKLDMLFLSAGCPTWGGINGPLPLNLIE